VYTNLAYIVTVLAYISQVEQPVKGSSCYRYSTVSTVQHQLFPVTTLLIEKVNISKLIPL